MDVIKKVVKVAVSFIVGYIFGRGFAEVVREATDKK